jgi:hypothetical protein
MELYQYNPEDALHIQDDMKSRYPDHMVFVKYRYMNWFDASCWILGEGPIKHHTYLIVNGQVARQD